MKEYQPIDCGFHSELELAIMHKKTLKICLKEQGEGNEVVNESTQICKPIDLVTRSHEELLIVEDQKGLCSDIRLDHIVDVTDVTDVTL